MEVSGDVGDVVAVAAAVVAVARGDVVEAATAVVFEFVVVDDGLIETLHVLAVAAADVAAAVVGQALQHWTDSYSTQPSRDPRPNLSRRLKDVQLLR